MGDFTMIRALESLRLRLGDPNIANRCKIARRCLSNSTCHTRQHPVDLSTVSIKIPQIGIHPVYYNSNNQSFPPIFIGAILNHKNVAIFSDIFVNIIAF